MASPARDVACEANSSARIPSHKVVWVTHFFPSREKRRRPARDGCAAARRRGAVTTATDIVPGACGQACQTPIHTVMGFIVLFGSRDWESPLPKPSRREVGWGGFAPRPIGLALCGELPREHLVAPVCPALASSPVRLPYSNGLHSFVWIERLEISPLPSPARARSALGRLRTAT